MPRTVVMGMAAAVMTLAGLAPVPSAVAQTAGKAPTCDKPMACKMCKPAMKAHAERMARVEAALYEAKGAAEATNDKVAVARISEALKLLEQDKLAMQKHMATMMQTMNDKMGKPDQAKAKPDQMKQKMQQKMKKMHADRKAKAKAGQKCPMCEKMTAGKAKDAKRPAKAAPAKPADSPTG